MKLSYLIPEGQYGFFAELIPALQSAGIDLEVNAITHDTDAVLAAILPVTHYFIEPIKASGKPLILWHWDQFPFVDYSEPRWAEYRQLLGTAAEVWSASYHVAGQLLSEYGRYSEVMPAWVDCDELTPGPVEDYVCFAASGSGMHKRIDWAQQACRILGYPLRLTTGQHLARAEYVEMIRRCRVYLMPAWDESNGSIPAVEAMAAGRSVVCSDLPSCREAFGDCAGYFPVWDFERMLDMLRWSWENATTYRITSRLRGLTLFDKQILFPRIINRLRAFHAAGQP